MQLFNSRRTEYRSPTGAVTFGTDIHFKIILPRDLACSSAVLALKDDKFGDTDVYGMYWCGMVGDDHEAWECNVQAEHVGLYWYHFALDTRYGKRFIMKSFGGEGYLAMSDHEPRFQLLCYEKDFESCQPE